MLDSATSATQVPSANRNSPHTRAVVSRLRTDGPRDIDIHLVNGNSCTNWSSQHSYAVGLASLITTC
jgi:transcriptional activator of cad operon